MARRFNTAGPCVPELHYMLPPERRLPEVRGLIDQQLYFVIHAPRQVGKTTCFRALAESLRRERRYTALYASCEAGQSAGGDVETGISAVLDSLRTNAEAQLPEDQRPPRPDSERPAETRLWVLLAQWCEQVARPVVLFLDEIDALIDDTLISTLRQLRSGYPDRPERFPASVALIGLRDVRDYRVQVRPEPVSLGTASPFNIKAESLTIRSFTQEEVAELYAQHTADTGQVFAPDAVERAFTLTRGQPWLVNALARQMVEKGVTDRRTAVTGGDVEAAKEVLIARRDTHLDSLIDRLREPRVRRVIGPLLAGELVVGDRIDDDVAYVEDLGLIERNQGGPITIANPIYHEIIPRALAAITQMTIPQQTAWYIRDQDSRLDMDGLLQGFADFWHEHGEALLASQPYPEAAPHLILMAFLQRVVNGGGTIDREYALGMGRMDLCIRWPSPGGLQKEALEIKVWRDRKADPLDQGLQQLTGYLDRLGLDHGYLILFDRRASSPGTSEPALRTEYTEVRHAGRRISVFRL
jgi:type II secretory pathway predicted ATPase ExeA